MKYFNHKTNMLLKLCIEWGQLINDIIVQSNLQQNHNNNSKVAFEILLAPSIYLSLELEFLETWIMGINSAISKCGKKWRKLFKPIKNNFFATFSLLYFGQFGTTDWLQY